MFPLYLLYLVVEHVKDFVISMNFLLLHFDVFLSFFSLFFLAPQMQFMLLFSRQGKLRLQKWYVPLSDKEKKKITRELVQTVLARKPKMCSFLEWRDLKIVYKRWIPLSSSPFPSLSLTPWICAHRYQSWACDTV